MKKFIVALFIVLLTSCDGPHPKVTVDSLVTKRFEFTHMIVNGTSYFLITDKETGTEILNQYKGGMVILPKK